MDVSADGDGCVDGLDVTFFDEDFAGFEAELFDLVFGDGLASEELGDLAGGWGRLGVNLCVWM